MTDRLSTHTYTCYLGTRVSFRLHTGSSWGDCDPKILTQIEGIQNLVQLSCQEPPREIPPMTKVMRRRPDRQRWIRIWGTPWTCSSIYPKTKVCLSTVYYIMPFTKLLTLTGGYPRPPFSEENQLKALVNKSPGLERSILILTPLLLF